MRAPPKKEATLSNIYLSVLVQEKKIAADGIDAPYSDRNGTEGSSSTPPTLGGGEKLHKLRRPVVPQRRADPAEAAPAPAAPPR
jgi:hypothetical protein